MSSETTGCLDMAYLKSLDARLKMTVLVCSAVGFVCAYISFSLAAIFYEFHAGTAFFITGWLFAFYLCRCVRTIRFPWHAFEAGYSALMAVLFLIGMICMFSFFISIGSILAGVAAIPPIGCFAFDGYKKLSAWRSGNRGPGQQRTTADGAGAGAGQKV